MRKFKFENYVSVRTDLNGKLEVEIEPKEDWNKLNRDANITIYDKDKRLVINTVADIDILIAKLQKVREELF